MKHLLQTLCCCVFLTVSDCFHASANDPAYQQRQADYISQALSNFFPDAITIQAYMGVPVDAASLQSILNIIPTKSTIDFDLVKLVRVLFYTNGAYDSLLLPAMNSIPYWVNKGDTLRGYWSENHMIQWMSCDWLLHERYGRAVDPTLGQRLRHYLRLKVQYGFYEFFSSTYAPYSLSGLLNLADFAQDTEIKDLSAQAAQRLLKDMLMLTNDKGVFFPVAGRNYYSKYQSPYGENHNHLIYLLTGFGNVPLTASHAGGFLATSSLPVDSIIASWTPVLDTVYSIGHSLDSGFVINSGLSHVDRIMFQWSSGAYFHPDVAQESAELLRDSVLWNHVDFSAFRSFSSFSVPTIVNLSNALSNASMSTVISGQDAVLFKHHSITLASLKDFWKGKVGFQQFPCVANVGTTAVMTASGKVEPNWTNRTSDNANEHLPLVSQKQNIALVMYRPEIAEIQGLLPFQNPEVALHFDDADFDEVIEDGLWLLGRQENNYVAVRRSCIGEINGARACEMNRGQAWALAVGDSLLYGSFNHFRNIISQSQLTESWYYDSTNAQSVYYARLEFDTVVLEYAWGVDSAITSGSESFSFNNSDVRIFPNPATDNVNIDLSSRGNSFANITVMNLLGAKIFSERIPSDKKIFSLSIAGLPCGVNFVMLESGTEVIMKKIIKL